MTGQKPPEPPQKHCPICGGELEIRIVSRDSSRHTSADTTCTKCGRISGYSWAPFTSRKQIEASGPEIRARMLEVERHLRDRRPPFIDAAGRVNLEGLLSTAEFPVYGLKDRPRGLRLQSPGGGNHRITLGYRSGHPHDSGAAFTLREETDRPGYKTDREAWGEGASALEALHVIWPAVASAEPERHKRWFHEGDFYRDWNVEMIRSAGRRRIEIEIAGETRQAGVTSFEKPQPVSYFTFALPPTHIVACAVNISESDAADALTRLVDLWTDRDAFADHQGGFDESHGLLWPE